MRYVIIAFIFSTVSFLWGDVIHLKNGRKFEGKVIKHKNKVEIQMGMGSVFFPREDIAKIISKKSPQEVYQEKYQQLDRNNPKEWWALVAWCKKNYRYKQTALSQEAQKVEREFFLRKNKKELAQKLERAGVNPDKLYQAALWCQGKTLPEKTAEEILKRVISFYPNHAGARKDLGQTLYNNQWMETKAAKELEERDFAARMRERGFMLYEGTWMKPDEANWRQVIDRLEKKVEEEKERQKQIEREKEEALKRLDESRDENRELVDQKNDLNSRISSLELEVRNHQEEKHRLDHKVRNIFRETDSLFIRIRKELNNPPDSTERAFVRTLRGFVESLSDELDDLEKRILH